MTFSDRLKVLINYFNEGQFKKMQLNFSSKDSYSIKSKDEYEVILQEDYMEFVKGSTIEIYKLDQINAIEFKSE